MDGRIDGALVRQDDSEFVNEPRTCALAHKRGGRETDAGLQRSRQHMCPRQQLVHKSQS